LPKIEDTIRFLGGGRIELIQKLLNGQLALNKFKFDDVFTDKDGQEKVFE